MLIIIVGYVVLSKVVGSSSTQSERLTGGPVVSADTTFVPKEGDISSLQSGRETHQVDLKLDQLAKLTHDLQLAKYQGLDTKGIEDQLKLGLKELKDSGVDTAKIEEGLGAYGEELRKEIEIADKLKSISEEKLSRVEIDKRLDEIPGVNKTEALKMLAKLELEAEANRSKGSLRIVANKRDGEDALKLDLSLSLDQAVPKESPQDKVHRLNLQRTKDERIDALLSKYPEFLSREKVEETIRGTEKQGLVDLYLSKTKTMPWTERRTELLNAGVFTESTEAKYRETVFRQEAKEVLALLDARYEKGLFLTPAEKGDHDSGVKVKAASDRIKRLEAQLDRMIADVPERLIPILGEELKFLRLKAGEAEVQGLAAYQNFKEGEEAKALAAYEKAARDGGALFATTQILTNARDAFPKLVESSTLLVGGNLAQAGGFVKGVVTLENPLTSARDWGSSYVEGSREFFNNNAWGGSTFGGDEAFSSKSLYSMGLKDMNPVAHFGDAVVSPAFSMIDVGRVEISRRQIVGKVLFGNIQVVADVYYGTDSDPIADLTYAQYRDLEQTDSLLKGSKYSFQVAEISASLAMGRPESLGGMTKMLSGSFGMGVVGSAGRELMREDGKFELGTFLENTLSQTADSSVFMAGMSGFSSLFVRSRIGNIGTKLAGGETLTQAELRLLQSTQKQAVLMREFIDNVDGLGDLAGSVGNFEEVKTARQGIGAILNFLTAASDVGDVNLGLGDRVGNGVDAYLAKRQDPSTGSGQEGSEGKVSVPVVDVSAVEKIRSDLKGLEGLSLTEVDSRTKEEILRTPAVALSSQDSKYDKPVSEILNYKNSREEVRAEYVLARTSELVKEGVNKEQAEAKATSESRRVVAFFNQETESITVERPRTLKEGENPSQKERLLDAFLVKHELDHYKQDPNLSIVEGETQSLLKRAGELNRLGFDLVLTENGSWSVVELASKDKPILARDPGYFQRAVEERTHSGVTSTTLNLMSEGERVENSQLVRNYPKLGGVNTFDDKKPKLNSFQMFSDSEVLRVHASCEESKVAGIESVSRVHDLKLGHNKIVIDNIGSTIPVNRVMDEGSVRHVIIQQNASSCVSTAASMLVLDYIAEKERLSNVWQGFKQSLSRDQKPDIDLGLLELVKFSSKTDMQNVAQIADKMLQLYKANLKVISCPAIDLTVVELKRLTDNYGSIALSVDDVEINGHEIVVDKIFQDPNSKSMLARVRDPFHGWMIDVEVSSLLKRLHGFTTGSIAFIVDDSSREQASAEIDYSKFRDLESQDDRNFNEAFEKVKLRVRNRAAEPRELSKLYSHMRNFIESTSWIESELARLKNEIQYKPIESLEQSMGAFDSWYEQVNNEFEEYVQSHNLDVILQAGELRLLRDSLNKVITLKGRAELGKLIGDIGNIKSFSNDILGKLQNLCRLKYQELSNRINKSLRDKNANKKLIARDVDLFINLTCLLLQAHGIQFALEIVDILGVKVPYLIINSNDKSKLSRDARRSIAVNRQALIFDPYTQIILNLSGTYEMVRKAKAETQKFWQLDLSNGSINLSLDDLIARANTQEESPGNAQLIAGNGSEVNWREGEARASTSDSSPINYLPTRAAFEDEFVSQERESAASRNEVFNEAQSRQRAKETFAFFSRLNDQIYSLAPETLQVRAKGELGPDRDTRILQAMAVIHELTHKRLNKPNPALNEEMALEQEIEVWKECALYLKARGYEFRFEEDGGWRIVQFLTEKESIKLGTKRREIERSRNVPAGSLVKLSDSEVEAISKFVEGSYGEVKSEAEVNGESNSKSQTRSELTNVRDEFEFRETGRFITVHGNVRVPIQNLVIEEREYPGHLRKNETAFYVDKSEIPALYAHILRTRDQTDENGSEDVNAFIDKKTGLIFVPMPGENETPEQTEARIAKTSHEIQHRIDLVNGRDLDEGRAYAKASRYTKNEALTTFDENRNKGAESRSLAASRVDARVLELKDAIKKAFSEKNISGLDKFMNIDLRSIAVVHRNGTLNSSFTGRGPISAGLPINLKSAVFKETRVVKIKNRGDEGAIIEREVLEIDVDCSVEGEDGTTLYTMICDPDLKEYDSGEGNDKRYYAKVGQDNYQVRKLRNELEYALKNKVLVDLRVAGFLGSELELISIGAVGVVGKLNGSFTGRGPISAGLPINLKSAVFKETRVVKIKNRGDEGTIIEREVLEIDVDCAVEGEDGTTLYTMICDPDLKEYDSGEGNDQRYYAKVGQDNYQVRRLSNEVEYALKNKVLVDLRVAGFLGSELELISIGAVGVRGILNASFTGRGLVSAGLPINLKSAVFKETRVVKIKNRGDEGTIIEREVLEIDVDCSVEGEDGTTLYTMICDPDLKEYDSGEGNDQRYYAKVGQDNYQVRKLRNEIEYALRNKVLVDLRVAGFLGSELELISIGAVGVVGKLNGSFTGRGSFRAGLPINLKSAVFKETRVVKIKNRGDDGTIIEREVLEIDVDCSVEGQDGTTLCTMIYDPDLKEYDSGEGNDQRYYAKVGQDNYQVRKLRNEVKYALKNKVLVDLEVAGFLGSELELISIGAVGLRGILNASFTGRGLVSAGLPARKLKSAVFKETRVVKIKNRGDEGTIIEREVLEIDVDCSVEGQDGTTLYTMICDPDLKEYDSGEGNDQRYYAKVGKDNYQVRKLRNEIVYAFSKGIRVDLEVAGFLGSDLELVSIGAVGVSGKLNPSFTGTGSVSAGLPAIVKSFKVLGSKFSDGALELRILCEREDGKTDIRSLGFDGENFFKIEKGITSVSPLKGDVLDMLLSLYVMKTQGEGSQYRKRFVVSEFTGEVREPNIVLNDGSWLHAKWGPVSQSVEYLNMLLRASQVVGDRGATPLEFLIYRDDVAKIVQSYGEALCREAKLGSQGLKVRSVLDYVLENGLGQTEKELLNELGDIEDLAEDQLKVKKEELEKEVQRFTNEGPGQIDLSRKEAWQQHVDAYLNNYSILKEEFEKLLINHSPYWNDSYHFHLVAYSAYVLKRLGDSDVDFTGQQEGEIRKVIYSLYPDLGVVEDLDRLIEVMCLADQGAAFEREEGAENVGEARRAIEPRKFQLGDYLELSTDTAGDRIIAGGDAGNMGVGFSKRHNISTLAIAGNLNSYLSNVLTRLGKEDNLSEDSKSEIRSSICSRIEKHLKEFRSDEFSRLDPRKKGSYESISIEQLKKVLASLELRDESQKLKEISRILLDEGGETLFTAKQVAQLKSQSDQEISNLWKEGEARTSTLFNPKSSPINYLPTRAAFENEFVSQERQSAISRNEEFNEAQSRQRARETFAFFSRLNDQIYSLTPETLQVRAEGEVDPDRDTRIMQAMAVIHELTHKRLNKPNPALNEEMALAQEIEVWKECALYLKARGYIFEFDDSGGWRIVQILSEEEANRLSAERRRSEKDKKLAVGSELVLSESEVEAIEGFVKTSYEDAFLDVALMAKKVTKKTKAESGPLMKSNLDSTMQDHEAEMHVFLEDTPQITDGIEYESMQRIANNIRLAARQDTVLKELGVELSDNFNLYLIDSPGFDAFVSPVIKDTVFISLGALDELRSEKLRIAVIGHEQGHQILDSLIYNEHSAKDSERAKLSTSEYKEEINTLRNRLTSVRQEIFSDTHGSLYYLSTQGVGYRDVVSLQATFARMEGSEDEYRQDYTTLSILNSHPSSKDRIEKIALVGSRLDFPIKSELVVAEKKSSQGELVSPVGSLVGKLRHILSNHLEFDSLLLSELVDTREEGECEFYLQEIDKKGLSNELNKLSVLELVGMKTILEAIPLFISRNDEGNVIFFGPVLTDYENRQEVPPISRQVLYGNNPFKGRKKVESREYLNQVTSLIDRVLNKNLSKAEKYLYMGATSADLTPDHLIELGNSRLQVKDIGPSFLASIIRDIPLARVYARDVSTDQDLKISIGRNFRGSIVLNTKAIDAQFYDQVVGRRRRKNLELVQKSVGRFAREDKFTTSKEFLSWLEELRDTYNSSGSNLLPNLNNSDLGNLIFNFAMNTSSSAIRDDLLDYLAKELSPEDIDLDFINSHLDIRREQLNGAVNDKAFEELCDSINSRFPLAGEYHFKGCFYARFDEAIKARTDFQELYKEFDKIRVRVSAIDLEKFVGSLPQEAMLIVSDVIKDRLEAELLEISRLTDPQIKLSVRDSKLIPRRLVNLHEEYSVHGTGEIKSVYRRMTGESFPDYLKRLELLPNKFSAEHWSKVISDEVSTVNDLDKFFDLINENYIDSKFSSKWIKAVRNEIKLTFITSYLDKADRGGAALSELDLQKLINLISSLDKSEGRNGLILRLIESFGHLDSAFLSPLLAELHFGDFSEQMYHRVAEIKAHSNEDWLKFEEAIATSSVGVEWCPESKLDIYRAGEYDASDNLEKSSRKRGYIKCLNIREVEGIKPALKEFLLKQDGLGSRGTVEAYRHGVQKYLFQKNGYPATALEMDSEIIRKYETCIRSFKDFKDPLGDVNWMPRSSADIDKRISYLCIVSPQATETRDKWLIKTFETAKESGIKISDKVLHRFKTAMLIESNKNLVAASLWENYLGSHDISEIGVLPVIKELRNLFPNYCAERNKAITQIRQYSKSYAEGRLMQMLWWDPGLPKAIPSINNVSMDATLQFQSEILRMLDDYEQLEVLLYLMGIYTREERGWAVDYVELGLQGTLENFRMSNRGLNSTDRREFLHSVFGGKDGLLARNNATAIRHLSHILTAVLLEGLPAESRNEATRTKIDSIVTAIFTNKSLPVYFKVEILDSLYAWLLKTEDSKDAIDSNQIVANLIKSVFSSIGGIGDRILQGLLVEPKLIPEEVKKHLREAQDKREFSSILAPFHALIKDGYEQVVLGRPIACGSIGEVHEVESLDGIEVKDLLAKTVRPETLAWLAIIETPLREICSVIGTHFDGWSDTPLNKIFESCRAEITAFEKEEARTGKFMADLLQKSLGGEVIQSPSCNYEIVRGDKLPNVLIPTAITDMKRSRKSDPSEGEYQRSMLIRDLGPNFKSMASIDRERGEKALKAHLKDEYGVELSDVANVAVSSFFGTFILSDAVMEDMHFGNVGIIAERGQKPKLVLLDFGGFLESFPKKEKDLIFSICKHIFMGDDDGLKRDLYRVVFNSGDLDHRAMPERTRVIDLVVGNIKTLRESGKPVEPVKVVEDVLASIYSGLSVSSELRTFCESLRKIAREWIPHVTGDELFGLSMQMMQEIINLNSREGGKVDSDAPLSNTLEAFEKLVLQHEARFKDVGVVFGKVLEEFRSNESYNELSLIVKDLLSDDSVISGLDSVLSKSSGEIREVIDKLRIKAKTEDAFALQGSLKASFDEIVALVNSEKVEIADFFKFVRLIVGDVSEFDGATFKSYQLRLKDFYAENSTLFTKSLRTILSTSEFRSIFADLFKDNEDADFNEWFNAQNKANLGPEETYQDVSKDGIQMARNYYEAIGDRIDKGSILWMQVDGEWKQYELANDYNIGAKNLNVFLKSASGSSRKTIDLPVKSNRQAYFEITIDDVCYKFSLSGLFQLIEEVI